MLKSRQKSTNFMAVRGINKSLKRIQGFLRAGQPTVNGEPGNLSNDELFNYIPVCSVKHEAYFSGVG